MKEILICECNSTEHQLVMMTIDREEPRACYVHVHLNSLPLWRRLVVAARYIIGKKSRYGAWDEFIFNSEDAEKLQKVVDYLKNKEQNG